MFIVLRFNSVRLYFIQRGLCLSESLLSLRFFFWFFNLFSWERAKANRTSCMLCKKREGAESFEFSLVLFWLSYIWHIGCGCEKLGSVNAS